MSEIQICRELTIRNDETGQSRTVNFKKIKDIFKFNDEAPYLAVGVSGGGKTTIAIDLIYHFGKEASKIYYVSATEETIGDGSINKVPKCFKKPCKLETLMSIWDEIKFNDKYSNASESTLLELMGRIYNKQEMSEIMKIYTEELNTFKEKNPNSDEIDIYKTEVLTKTILLGLKLHPNLDISAEDRQALNVLVSKQQKTILILDDVSSELNNLKNIKNKKINFNGVPMSLDKAFVSLLIDIFTKGRHYNLMCVLFVHDWNVIDLKQYLKNFIVLDINACDRLNSFRSISNKVRSEFSNIGKQLFIPQYKYSFIISKNLGEEIYISRADLHTNDDLEFDEINNKYIEMYNKVLSNNSINNVNDLSSLI